MGRLKVVILDDADEADVFRRAWESILGQCQFNSEVRLERFTDRTDSEIGQVLEDRPHIVIMDNVMEKATPERKNFGIELIEKYKVDHQDTLFILYTGRSFNIDQLGVRRPNPDLLITKTYLGEDGYRKYIAGRIDDMLRRAPLISHSGSSAGDAVIRSLIEQVVHERGQRGFGRGSGYNVKLTQLTGGFSGSAVYRMEVSGEDRYSDLPVILKVSSIEQIEREKLAFLKWVRWQLPHTMRVDVIGEGIAGKKAALGYAFVLGGEQNAVQGSEALRRGKIEVINTVTNLLFKAEKSGWYRAGKDSGRQVVEYFTNHWEFEPAKDQRRNDGFVDALKELSKLEGISSHESGGEITFGPMRFEVPRRIFLSMRKADNVFECMCHGDLNANNCFFDTNLTSFALIDFEGAGLNHVFRDFVSFESSVRLELLDSTSTPGTLHELVEMELAALDPTLSAPNPAWPGYLRQAWKLRVVAREKNRSVSWELYEVALGLHLWKLFGVNKWSIEQQRRLSGGLVAAMLRLAPRAGRTAALR